MLISVAQAQDAINDTMNAGATAATEAPSAANAFVWNVGLILVLVVMFYVLLIRPQQKRFQEHKAMQDALKKGDKIVTSGGLIGKIDKIKGDDEIVVDLGNSVKVTALRSTIQAQAEDTPTEKRNAAAKSIKKAPVKKTATKK